MTINIHRLILIQGYLTAKIGYHTMCEEEKSWRSFFSRKSTFNRYEKRPRCWSFFI